MYKFCKTIFFVHHKNLLATIFDESLTICELGYRQIMQPRENSVHRNTYWKLQQLKLLFHSTAFHLMIDWHLITRRVSSNCLMSQIKSKETPSAHTDFLCHTQAVERHIKFIFNFFLFLMLYYKLKILLFWCPCIYFPHYR